jgi:hypothetical protein
VFERCGLGRLVAAARHIFSLPAIPSEIRWKIWEPPLPGPRVLSIAYEEVAKMLQFLIEHNTPNPNPATLTTCLTSREAALSRYRPAFGHSHVYADLQGGDMIDFGLWNEHFVMGEVWSCLAPAAVVDLENVSGIHVESFEKWL